MTGGATRRVLTNEPMAPAAKRRVAEVEPTTSTTRSAGGDGTRRARRPDHGRLARKVAGKIVEVGRLLHDLAAALVDPSPPVGAGVPSSQRPMTSSIGRSASRRRTSGRKSSPRQV